MIQITLAAIITLAILGMTIARPRLAAMAYLVAIMLAPTVPVGGTSVRVEYLLTPLMLAVMVWRGIKLRGRFPIPAISLVFLAWWVWCVAVALFSGSLDWIGSYGSLRPLLMVPIFYNVAWEEHDYFRLHMVLAAVSVPLSMLAIGQTCGFPGARELTQFAYTSPARTVVRDMLDSLQQGFMFRAVAVFENVSYAGAVFVVIIGALLYFAISGKTPVNKKTKARLLIASGLAFIAGCMTLSATYVGGLLVVVCWLALTAGAKGKLRIMGVLAVVFAGSAILYFGYLKPNALGDSFIYPLTKLSSMSGMAGRYSSDAGVTAAAQEGFAQRIITGWGFTPTNDVFVGDSLFVSMAYSGGIIGMTLFFGPLLLILGKAMRSVGSRKVMALWVLVFLVAGVGAITVFVPRFTDWFWGFIGVWLATAASGRRKLAMKQPPGEEQGDLRS